MRAVAATAIANLIVRGGTVRAPHTTVSASGATATVTTTEPMWAHFMRDGVIAHLSPLLADLHVDAAIAAAGALRNLSVVGGDAVCEALINSDAVTGLLAVMQDAKYAPGAVNDAAAATRDKRDRLLTQATALLTNLTEHRCVSPILSYPIAQTQSHLNFFLLSSVLSPCSSYRRHTSVLHRGRQ
jgi:hypothetical protein